MLPVAYTRQTRETPDLIKFVLEQIKYKEYMWDICGDFKIIGLLMGLQPGNIKYGCFLCQWDSREKSQYLIMEWLARTPCIPGIQNMQYEPIVPKDKILMPPLHIKLGLFKNFIKALNKESRAMNHLQSIYPKLTKAKLHAGVLNGPDIRKLCADTIFPNLLSEIELSAWQSMITVVDEYLSEF